MSELFFIKNPNLKRKKNFLEWGTDIRTSPNQFAPSSSSKLGAYHCINLQVMALTSSMYDHFII